MFITTKQEENTKENGSKTESTVMVSCSTQTRTVTKVTGSKDKDVGRVLTNTPMATHTQENGETTLRTVMECLRWQQGISTKETGLTVRKMDLVCF